MIEKAEDLVSFWMLLSACVGFLVGETCGDYGGHRKCLQQENEELRDRLETAAADKKPIQRALKEQRGVIHDIHAAFWQFQKASKNAPPKSNEINGRISPNRPFHKVYLKKQLPPQSTSAKHTDVRPLSST